MNEKILKDIRECMWSVAVCDEQTGEDGLCSCARLIASKFDHYSRIHSHDWCHERINFLEDCIKRYRHELAVIREMAEDDIKNERIAPQSSIHQIEANARAAIN